MRKETNEKQKNHEISKLNNKMKNDKGSITIFVLLSMIFFVIILSGVFIASMNKQKLSLNYVEKIADNYNADANEVYNNIYHLFTLTVNPGGETHSQGEGTAKEITAPEQTTYTVTYETNEGSSVESSTVSAEFVSWTLTGEGSLSDEKSSTTTFTFGDGDATLTANYENNESITLPETQKEGHVFLGWYKDAECTNKVGDEGESYTPTGNITLYARWEEELSGTLSITGDTYILKSTTYGYSGVTGVESVEWSSSNTNIATISNSGVVTPVMSGTFTLTAKVTGFDGTT